MGASWDLLKRRVGFRRLWAAETLSLLGDWLSWVAVSLLALDHGGGEGALALALVFVGHNLPHAILTPVSGWVADRFDRRQVLLWAHLGQLVLTLGMAAAAAGESLWTVQALIWIRSSVAAIELPARTSAVKRLVEPDELYLAHRLSSATWSAAFAVGMGLGGVLALLGPVPALLVDASTFGVAGAVLLFLPALPPRGETLARSWAPAWTELRRPEVLRVALAKAPLSAAGGGGLVAMGLYAEAHPFLGAAGLTLGTLQLVKGLGTGVGPFLLSAPREGALWMAHLLTHVAIGAFVLVGGPAVWVGAALLWGVGAGVNWVVSVALLQQRVGDEVLGRLSAVDGLFSTAAMCASALVGGVLADATGQPAAAAAFGLVLGGIGSAVLAGFTLVRPVAPPLVSSAAAP